MNQSKPYLILALLIFVMGASATNYVGDKDIIIRLTGEVMTLQKQVRDLQESFDKTSAQSAMLLQKMSENSETTIRTLGQIEENVKTNQTLQNNTFTGTATRINRIADQQTATDQKLAQIASQITGLKSYLEQQQRQKQEEEQKAAQAPPRFDSPEQLYSFAYSLFTQGKFDEATVNFRRYVEAYGTTEAADNAQYWIADGLFAQARYGEALAEFDKLLTTYPNGDRVIASQYKKGIALLYLERREDGVAALRLVIANAPNSNEAALAKQELEKLGENINIPSTKPAKGRTRAGN